MNEDDRLEQAKSAVREYLSSAKSDFAPGVIDAIEVARLRTSVVTGVKNPDRPPWREGMTLQDAAELYRLHPDLMAYDDTKAGPLIRQARTDALAFAVLKEITAEIIDHGEPLPPKLGKFVVANLGKQGPARKPGQRRKQPRDVHIATAVHIACGFEFRPNRSRLNRANEPHAAAIVAEILAEMKMGISAATVEGIWNAHAHMLKPS